MSSQKFYDRLSFFYPIVDLFLQPQKRKFFDKINRFPYGHLLEIGVGNGSHLRYYKTHAIIGIDTSEKMLENARKHQHDAIQLVHMNGEKLLFPNETFDYVILSHVIAVVEKPETLLQEVHRVLKPKGKIFILNHVTPENGLKYLDQSFEGVSKLLHFKSVFKISTLSEINNFKLIEESNAGMFSYFKILIYEKNV